MASNGKKLSKSSALIKTWPIETFDLRKLKPDPDNPNVMKPEQAKGLHKSIDHNGLVGILIVDQNNVLVDGHWRVRDLLERGVTQAQGFRVQCKDHVERRLIRQAVNYLHGQPDPQKQALELRAILDGGRLDLLAEIMAQPREIFERAMARFDLFEFTQPEAAEDIEAAFKGEALVKPGELWKLGDHLLLCGDGARAEDVRRLFADGAKVHQLNVDFPYGVDVADKNEYLNSQDGGKRNTKAIKNDGGAKEIQDYRAFFASFLDLVPFAPTNTVYIFMGGQELHNLRLATEDAGFTWGHYLIWVKNNHSMGRKDYKAKHEFVYYGWKGRHKFYGEFSTTVLEYDKPQANKEHPTMKPVELVARLISDGTKKGDVVYDPCGGSGPTLIACEQMGRKCRMIEIDPAYCTVIIRRWENMTKQKAQLVTNGKGGDGPYH